MTSNVVSPSDYNLRGVFLIARDDLLELDAVLGEVEKEYKRYANRKLNDAVKKHVEDSRLQSSADTARIRKELKSRYPFNHNERTIELICASKRKFTGSTLQEILEIAELAFEKPVVANIKLRQGGAELSVKLLGQFVIDSIDISVSPNSAFAQRSAQKIRQWADERRRFDWYRNLAFPVGFFGFMLLVFSLLFLPSGVLTTTSDKSTAINEVRQLLANGIAERDLPKAVESLLRFQINEFQTSTRVDVKPWYVTLNLLGAGLFVFGLSCPRSIIGVGLYARRLRRMRFIYGKLWFWVGAWVFAILTSALGSTLYEIALTNLIPHPVIP